MFAVRLTTKPGRGIKMIQNSIWDYSALLLAFSMAMPVTAIAQQNGDTPKDNNEIETTSNWSTSIGIKLHPNKLSGIAAFNVQTPTGTVTAADSINSGTELAPILLGSIRYKNFFVSASHFLDTDYDVKTQLTGAAVNLSRNESDVNIGYYVLPSLSLSVGYKEIKVDGGLGDAKYAGPVVGISGYGSIGSGFGLYGSFAYGAFTITSSASVPSEGKDHSYLNSEVGLSYSFDFRESAHFLNSITLTLGYRYQDLESKNGVPVQLVTLVGGVPTAIGPPTPVRLNNTSQGPVVALIVSF
jgi:hypothetical protein